MLSSPLIVYANSSTAAVTADGASTSRTLGARFGDVLTIKDFGGVSGSDATSAVGAANTALSSAGGTLRFPNGSWSFTFSYPPDNVLWEFDGPLINRAQLNGGSTVNVRKATYGVLSGPHSGTRTSLVFIKAEAEGSSQNGVTSGDVAHEINIFKQNWTDPATAVAGEIDGQVIYARQGGPTTGTKSAVGGQVIDVGMTNGTGWCGHYEHVSTVFDQTAGLATLYQIDIQAGVLNTRDGDRYGHILNAQVGTMQSAVYTKNVTGTSAWTDIIKNDKDGITNFEISDSGKITWKPDNSGTVRWTVENNAGTLQFKKADQTTVYLALKQSGVISMPGLPTSASGLSAGDLWCDTAAGNVIKRV